MQNLFHKMGSAFASVEEHSHTHHGTQCYGVHSEEHNNNRYQSFAPQTAGQAKWYVDGCSYFWAVSEALEQAQSSIYILDWWLSPELYLRRPPSKNEKYRLDNLLKAAAERGVQVRVIVYKEVPQALTLNSVHTKHALEALHPNIRVFRHPDHLPSGHDLQADVTSAFQNLDLKSFDLAKLGKDALKTIYGTSDDMVLYWAHHEKLCVIDDTIAFMGGLDMCFGRWDTNSHPIADAHPGNLDAIIFPGQDYNNARVYDFADVDKWENNKLDRTKSSRMGWSDISICLSGHIVNSLVTHFVDRWNFMFDQKYATRKEENYQRLQEPSQPHNIPSGFRGTGRYLLEGGQNMLGSVQRHMHSGMNRIWGEEDDDTAQERHEYGASALHIQLTRSCAEWSSGHKTEHSIANAYINIINSAEHFVYIENQFFITATSNEQLPVANKIGRAIVDRIVRAHQNGEDFGMIVSMPSVPAFAGDLHADGALGTRAIMEFQYKSISRGGHSIYEELRKAGVQDPTKYLRFYNLRNYDRINTAPIMHHVEEASGVPYETARREFDDAVESGYDGYSRDEETRGQLGENYRRYQEAARQEPDEARTADSVSACYMDGGPSLAASSNDPSLRWGGGSPEDELNAFVSEELYIHSKVLIADDRVVICGSANLNDRSQLGNHDSEIAVIIEDPNHPVQSSMNGQPYVVNAFAAGLRRQLFRKHLGLLPHQRCDKPTNNFLSISTAPNDYDWGSPADKLVADPLSPNFRRLWTATAKANTDAFDDVFHCVPSDHVKDWNDYWNYFARNFIQPGDELDKDGKPKKAPPAPPGLQDCPQQRAAYGHVVPDYPGGVEAVKARLGEIRGNLVEMPLDFLVNVKDIAKEGLALNSLTDELYT